MGMGLIHPKAQINYSLLIIKHKQQLIMKIEGILPIEIDSIRMNKEFPKVSCYKKYKTSFLSVFYKFLPNAHLIFTSSPSSAL